MPQLLNDVAQGETVSITRYGIPVAMLVPASGARRRRTSEAIAEIRDFRRGKTLGSRTIRDLIEDGRRY